MKKRYIFFDEGKPEECLLIDDNKDNFESVKAYGIHAVGFQSHETSYNEVMDYLERCFNENNRNY